MKTKILHISNTVIEFDSRILKELSSLSETNFYEIYVLGLMTYNKSSNLDFCKQLSVTSYTTKFLKFTPRPFRYVFNLLEFNFKVLFKGFPVKPDVIHVHDTFGLLGAIIIKFFIGSSIIYDAHELESDKNGQSKILSLSTLLLEKLCWKSIDHFITVSDSIRDWYWDNFSEVQSTIVYNSPIINTKTVGEKWNLALKDEYGITKDCRSFVYLGILMPGRGIEIFIETFKEKSNNLHLIIIGDGPLKEVVLSAAHNSPNIHYHPLVPHDQVVDYVSNFDFGLCLLERVSLSDYYALPNKFFEYSFAGLSMIASNFPEISAAIEKYNLGVCCEPDKISFSNAIDRIVSEKLPDPKPIYELSWESQSIKLKELYFNLIKR